MFVLHEDADDQVLHWLATIEHHLSILLTRGLAHSIPSKKKKSTKVSKNCRMARARTSFDAESILRIARNTRPLLPDGKVIFRPTLYCSTSTKIPPTSRHFLSTRGTKLRGITHLRHGFAHILHTEYEKYYRHHYISKTMQRKISRSCPDSYTNTHPKQRKSGQLTRRVRGLHSSFFNQRDNSAQCLDRRSCLRTTEPPSQRPRSTTKTSSCLDISITSPKSRTEVYQTDEATRNRKTPHSPSTPKTPELKSQIGYPVTNSLRISILCQSCTAATQDAIVARPAYPRVLPSPAAVPSHRPLDPTASTVSSCSLAAACSWQRPLSLQPSTPPPEKGLSPRLTPH